MLTLSVAYNALFDRIGNVAIIELNLHPFSCNYENSDLILFTIGLKTSLSLSLSMMSLRILDYIKC